LSLHGYGRHINSTSPKGVIFMTDEFSVLFQCYCYSFNLWILLAAGTSLLAFYFSCYHIGLEFLTTWRWRVFALKHRLLMFFYFLHVSLICMTHCIASENTSLLHPKNFLSRRRRVFSLWRRFLFPLILLILISGF